MSTLINWPIVLGSPNFETSATTEAPVVTTKMDSGYVRQRNRFSANTKTRSVFWNFDQNQYLLFLAFHKHRLSNGALSFNIDIPHGTEETSEVIILGGNFSETPLSDQYIKVSLTLFQHNPSAPEDTWLYLWEWYEGDPENFLEIEDMFNTYVNETLPSHYS